MLYCSWDMACDGCNYFSFWAIFCPFTPVTAWKIKIKKKMKTTAGDIIILHNAPEIMIICYTVPKIWHMTDVIAIFSFWAIFCPFTLPPPKQPKKSKFKKNKDMICLEIWSFYICVPKIMIRWCMVPEIWCATDRWTDRDGKSDI